MAGPDDVAMAARELFRDAVLSGPRGTQAQLARDLGVSAQTVSSWLSGDLPIHPRWFLPIESALSMDSFAFAEATGLADALGFKELNDYERQLERWQLVFGDVDDDALPPRRENRGYKPSDRVRELEARLEALELEVAATKGQARQPAKRTRKRPSPKPNE